MHDLDQVAHLARADDEVVYADAGYQGAEKRPDVAADADLSGVEWRIAARKGALRAMPGRPDRAIQSAQAGVPAKVEHRFLSVKRGVAFVKTPTRLTESAREKRCAGRHAGSWIVVVDGCSGRDHQEVRVGVCAHVQGAARGVILDQVCSVTGWSRDNDRRRLVAAARPCGGSTGAGRDRRSTRPRRSGR